MNKRILQQENRKIASSQILKRKLHVFFLSFFLLFFSSFWHLQPKYKQQNRQNGKYQVAVKKNYATVDNHQDV
jgi:hypothetical protein